MQLDVFKTTAREIIDNETSPARCDYRLADLTRTFIEENDE